MSKHIRLALLGALAALAGAVTQAPAADSAAGDKIRVLIVDGQNNHNWRATTPLMKKELEQSGRFTVDVATSPEMPHRPQKPTPPQKPKTNDKAALARYEQALAKYQAGLPAAEAAYKAAMEKYPAAEAQYREAMARFHPDLSKYDVLLSNYNGDAWPKAFQDDLDQRLREGKIGLVIVHAANNSFTNWADYNRMIGMGWRGNNFGDRLIVDAKGQEMRVPKGKGPGAGHGAKHAFLVTIRDSEHPITKGMPAEWMHCADELYHGMRGPAENVHLLATAYSDKSKGGTGEHEPMIWTVSYGKGRVFHTPMGHDVDGMRCLGFVGTLERGTEWAATGKVSLPLPRGFPSAEKTSSLPAK